jgi:hypothetical protein
MSLPEPSTLIIQDMLLNLCHRASQRAECVYDEHVIGDDETGIVNFV